MANIFNIGISALVSAQHQLSTTSHNIANVNTDGYSRQRVELTQFPPQPTSTGFLGNGVRVSEISRIADEFLIGQLRTANANGAKASVYANYSGQVDSMLGDGSVTKALDGFFSALHDANGDPASISSREVLLSSARSFASRFSDLERRLGALERDVNGGIEAAVAQINSLSRSIADINGQITQALGRATGAPPNDLLDQRDRLVAELGTLTGVSTIEQENGALNVFIGTGQPVVTDVTSIPLRAVPNPLDGSRLEVATVSGGVASIVSQALTNGELGAVLEFRDEVLGVARNSIGRLAAALALSVNELHREGFDLNDDFGGDLFSIGTPDVNADPANSGTVTVSLDPTNIAGLTTANYRLSHDGTNFTLTNLGDSTSQVLAGAGPFMVEGLTIAVATAPAAGDTYLIQPTRSLARNMTVNVTSPRDFALARPNRTSASAANIGSGGISAPQVLDINNVNLLTATQIVFNDPPTTFQINGAGPLIPYTAGANIDQNGWRVQIAGAPQPGDQFTVGPNAGGAGDNGNGLRLNELQLTKLIDGATATYQETFSRLVGQVGAKTAEMQLRRDAMEVLRQNAKASRDALSGVNLDEEAAQLLRFQQAYSAAAEVISIANDTFASLLSAVRR